MQNNKFAIIITGDFCPINRWSSLDQNTKPETVFGNLSELFNNANLSITNLECPITTHQKPILKTGPTLKATINTIGFLKKAGFSLVTLANNHIMDYGRNGLEDTLVGLKSLQIDFIGAGLDFKQATEIYYKKINHLIVAIINVCENEWATSDGFNEGANPIETLNVFYQIKSAKQNADYVILITHGGHEMYELPSPRIKQLFRGFVDMGADVVVNHHTHCISGNEVYQGKHIFYSLGNFVFDNPKERNSIWNLGLAVRLFFENNSIMPELYYFYQSNDKKELELAKGEALSQIENKVNRLNTIIQDDQLLHLEFKNYCNSKFKMYKSYLEPHANKYLIALQNRNLFPSFWSKRKKMYLQNLVQCEAHKDVVINLLKHENSNS